MKEIDRTKPKTPIEKLKSILKLKTPLYRTWWLYPLALLMFVVLVFVIPIIINELYKVGDGYIALWGASEILAFYAVILSGVISITTVIVTVYCSKKGTDRQIRFYMSQMKTPFFTTELVSQKGNADSFYYDGHRRWIKEYHVLEPGNLPENGLIEITVKNIGEGIALAPSYQIDMMASTIIPDNIVENNKYLLLSFDLLRNLNEKYVRHHFVEGFEKYNTGTVVYFTRIYLNYKNILGVDLQQEILVEIEFDFSTKLITIKVNELSPQRVLI